MAGIGDLVTALNSALGIGPNGSSGYREILVGRRELARNVDFPQYWIVPVDEEWARTPQGPGAAGNPQVFHARGINIEIYSWGGEIAATEDLHETMFTALRAVLAGANYVVRATRWEEPTDQQRGNMLVSTVTINMNVTKKTLPIPPGTYGPDFVYPTVVVTQVNFDTTGSVPGDGLLDAGE